MSNILGPADDTDREHWAEHLRRVAESYRGHPKEGQVAHNLHHHIWLEIVLPGEMPDGQVTGYRVGRRHISRMTSATLAQLAALPVPPPPSDALEEA